MEISEKYALKTCITRGRFKIGVLKEHLLKEFSSLGLNLARLKCLTLLVASLLRHRTVNLTILSTENLSGALILRKIPRPERGWTLSMDRTNWKYGKRHLNILTVGVVVNKVAILIAWIVLPQKTKRGNSNTKQRIKIFKKVLQIAGPEDIFVLTMDREFGGKEWLKWLDQKGVGFVVRIKKNIIVGQKSADEYPMSSSAKRLRIVTRFGRSSYSLPKK